MMVGPAFAAVPYNKGFVPANSAPGRIKMQRDVAIQTGGEVRQLGTPEHRACRTQPPTIYGPKANDLGQLSHPCSVPFPLTVEVRAGVIGKLQSIILRYYDEAAHN